MENLDEEEIFGEKCDDIKETRIKIDQTKEEAINDSDSDTSSVKHRREVREQKQAVEMQAKKADDEKRRLDKVSEQVKDKFGMEEFKVEVKKLEEQ